MAFPDIVATLVASGFDGSVVDYRRGTTTYFAPDGGSVVLANPQSATRLAVAFDQSGIAARIRWAQANPPGFSYAKFCAEMKALGCAGYVVSSPGRRVLLRPHRGDPCRAFPGPGRRGPTRPA